MKGGYAGKMLFVDLTTRSFEVKELHDELATRFIGGYGIGARVLYDMMKPGIDPLGPENLLGFVTGPLTATGALFSGRYMVVCKSPVTGGWNDANSGGYFGPELKRSGFDAVFITGVSDKPVYLWINDGKVEIRDAGKLWGKDSSDALDALIEETGENKLRAALIGPPGENLSLFSCVMNEKHRAAARGGAGAVMGSKKLKAVAVRGTGKIPVADPERLKKINRSIVESMKSGPGAQVSAIIGTLGTGFTTPGSAINGDSPVKNWGGVGIIDFGEESAQKLSVGPLDSKYKTKKYACAGCPLGCGADYKVTEGDWHMEETYRPEYETWAAFGSMCLNDNPEAILKCNDLCNRYGLDTISMGSTIAWAMECYEHGILTKEETDGIELTWGNAHAMVAITEAICENKGIGKILALGSRRAAEVLGKGSEYVQTINGLEVPMHDPKYAPGYCRTYQIDPTPARHSKGGIGVPQSMDPENKTKYDFENTGKGDFKATTEYEVLSAAGLCMFSNFVGVPHLPKEYLEAVTGVKLTEEDIDIIGTRIFNMRYAFNLREGQRSLDVKVPPRVVGEEPQKEGPLKGITIDHHKLHCNFSQALKWDPKMFVPTRDALEELGGMADLIKKIWE